MSCKQPTNIRTGPDYLQVALAPFFTKIFALIGPAARGISRRRTAIHDPG